MSCFPCFRKSKKSAHTTEAEEPHYGRQRSLDISAPYHVRSGPLEAPISARTFTFRELAAATKNFRQDNFIGQGGFGSVYKGRLENGQVVAIKQLDKNGTQGNKEFLVEVLMLSLLKHPNLVNLIGYCADGDQRLLVYEYMPLGSVEDRLYDAAVSPDKEPLDWKTRIIIAEGAAKGLEYLHDEAKPPVIYRDLKTANILLDEGFHPKLSDFGLAKLGPVGDQSHVSTRVMGTYGYCAPEYALTGQLTKKSDIYSFGVVLLELITGKPALDETKPHAQQSLVSWARPYLSDRNKMVHLADPLLRGRCQMRSLYQAVAVAAVCLHDVPEHRPRISDIVMALSSIRNSIPAPSTPATVSRPLAAASLHRNISANDVQNEGKNQIAYYEENPAKDNARATS